MKQKWEVGTGIGLAALALSIISLFVLPVLFGIVGIIVGFIAVEEEAQSLVLGQLVLVLFPLFLVYLFSLSFNK